MPRRLPMSTLYKCCLGFAKCSNPAEVSPSMAVIGVLPCTKSASLCILCGLHQRPRVATFGSEYYSPQLCGHARQFPAVVRGRHLVPTRVGRMTAGGCSKHSSSSGHKMLPLLPLHPPFLSSCVSRMCTRHNSVLAVPCKHQ